MWQEKYGLRVGQQDARRREQLDRLERDLWRLAQPRAPEKKHVREAKEELRVRVRVRLGLGLGSVLQRRNTYGKPKKSCGEKRRLSAVLRGLGAEEERWRRR